MEDLQGNLPDTVKIFTYEGYQIARNRTGLFFDTFYLQYSENRQGYLVVPIFDSARDLKR